MQRQWTIEARIDSDNPEVFQIIGEIIRVSAVHINAQMSLIQTTQKPMVVAFSDDYFTGHEEISLMEDTLGRAIAENDGNPDQVSEDLLQAVRDMK